MADARLLDKVHGLSDLELAGLLCLMSREHCLISTPSEALTDLVGELKAISSITFGLKCTVVDCTPQTTLDDFAAAILIPPTVAASRAESPYQSRGNAAESYFGSRPGALTPLTYLSAPSRMSSVSGTAATTGGPSNAPSIANIIIAKDLDQAPKAVQIQALELLRTRRIFTRTSVQAAPKQFLFIAVVGASSGGQARVTPHLNEAFYLAHWHDPDDGFLNLEQLMDDNDDRSDLETASMESVVKKSVHHEVPVAEDPVLRDVDIATLARLSQDVRLDVDVMRYLMNIVSYMRMHRAVGGGISPAASKHFEQLVKSLAPLHQLDYVTPALVALALKKVYLHRIQLVELEQERSMQWGSKLEAVEVLLDDFGPEEVMEEVLEMVAVPL